MESLSRIVNFENLGIQYGCIRKNHGRFDLLLGVVISVDIDDDTVHFRLLKVTNTNDNLNLPPTVALKLETHERMYHKMNFVVCDIFLICVLTITNRNIIAIESLRGVNYVNIIEDCIDSLFLFDLISCSVSLVWYELWYRISVSMRDALGTSKSNILTSFNVCNTPDEYDIIKSVLNLSKV